MPPKDKDKKEKKEKKKKNMITFKDNGAVKFLAEDETPFDEIQSSECNCKGREFCQIVHSGDTTPFQIGVSETTGTELIVNGSFTLGTGWTIGPSWSISGGKARHTIGPAGTHALSQVVSGLLASTYYKIVFTISNYSNSQTLSVIFGGDTVKTLNANGTYTVYWFTDAVLGGSVISFVADDSTELHLDNVSVQEMSSVVYGIKNLNDVVIKTISNGIGVTYYQDIASIEVDWSDVADGCYRLFVTDSGITYQSECFIRGTFDCTKLLSWTNNENAYGFIYDGTTFQHELRVKSKLWKAKYPKDKKEVFVDSAGNRRILTSRTKKEELLSLEEIPTYLHDAFSIGLEHDNFYIDGVKYINEETDYDPAWRNSSLLAPVEVTVTKDSQDLSNSYC